MAEAGVTPTWSHRAVQDEPGFSTVISPWKSLVVHSSTLSLSPIMLWVTQFSHPLSRNCRGRMYGLQTPIGRSIECPVHGVPCRKAYESSPAPGS